MITLINDYNAEDDGKPERQGDRRLARLGGVLRKHLDELQKPRDKTRALEKELARTPHFPDNEAEIDAKIKEYDKSIQISKKELKRTDQADKLKKLENKSFSDAGGVPVHSRIPTAFTVNLDYEAVAGPGGSVMVKADSKGTRKEFSKTDFEIPPGVSAASYGTIDLSNAPPATPLIIEDKASKKDKSKQTAKAEEDVPGKTGTGGESKTKQRFKSSFVITQV